MEVWSGCAGIVVRGVWIGAFVVDKSLSSVCTITEKRWICHPCLSKCLRHSFAGYRLTIDCDSHVNCSATSVQSTLVSSSVHEVRLSDSDLNICYRIRRRQTSCKQKCSIRHTLTHARGRDTAEGDTYTRNLMTIEIISAIHRTGNVAVISSWRIYSRSRILSRLNSALSTPRRKRTQHTLYPPL